MEYKLGSNEHFIITKNNNCVNIDESISINEITYSALKNLRDNNNLVPGQQYRITDYVTTTASEGTQSGGHQFDIIVRADDANKLNENAYAALHSGDTYFANSKLEAWELKYCLDNDIDKYAWADTQNGKGIIYYMKDEFNNECPYDFKNLQFLRYKTIGGGKFYDNKYYGIEVMGEVCPGGATLDRNDYKYLFTFTDDSNQTVADKSLNKNSIEVYNNVIRATFDSVGDYGMGVGFIPNNIVFNNNCSNNTFDNGCYGNTFGNYCYSNIFGTGCYSNIFGTGCSSNTFGNVCYSNTFDNGCYGNTFGNYCFSNSFGNECYSNSFGNSCSSNYFGYTCHNNSFGDYYEASRFGNYFFYNSFQNSCSVNSFGNYCYSNSFGNECYSNSFGDNCFYNSFGNSCSSNSFGNSCSSNTFGNSCSSNTFGKSYVAFVIIENGNHDITLTSSETTSEELYLQNIKIAQGVNNSNTQLEISHNTLNDKFQTIYRAQESQDVYLKSQGYY